MKFAPKLFLWLVARFLVCSSAVGSLQVKVGDNVILPCSGPSDATQILIRWIRPDLESEGYVFCFKDGKECSDSQHPSFNGQVKLKDPEMKNGDFSVVLKNVSISDTGTYECIVGHGGNKPELISNTNLMVKPGDASKQEADGGNEVEADDQNKGNTSTAAAVLVPLLVLCVVVVGVWIYRKLKGRQNNRRDSRPDQQTELQQHLNHPGSEENRETMNQLSLS